LLGFIVQKPNLVEWLVPTVETIDLRGVNLVTRLVAEVIAVVYGWRELMHWLLDESLSPFQATTVGQVARLAGFIPAVEGK
jgi:hypothetical protein